MRNKDIKEIKKYSKEYKSKLSIGLDLREVIVGLILGDVSSVRRYSKSNAVLKFCQGEKNKDYLYHLYNIFEKYVATPPRCLVLNRKGKKYTQYSFQTLSFEVLNEFRDKFYDKNGRKIIPSDIGKEITARSLAYWYMDDGAKQINGYTLHTENFSKKEVEFLGEILKEKFKLKISLHVKNKEKDQYTIYIGKVSKERFKDIISPYIDKSMMKKL